MSGLQYEWKVVLVYWDIPRVICSSVANGKACTSYSRYEWYVWVDSDEESKHSR